MFYVAKTKKKMDSAFNESLAGKIPQKNIMIMNKIRNDQIIFCGSLHKKVKLEHPFYKEK